MLTKTRQIQAQRNGRGETKKTSFHQVEAVWKMNIFIQDKVSSNIAARENTLRTTNDKRLSETNTFISIILEDQFYEILGKICFLTFKLVHSNSSCKYVSTGSNFFSCKSIIFRFLICVFQILTNISCYHRTRLISLTSYTLQQQCYGLFTLRKFIILRRAE